MKNSMIFLVLRSSLRVRLQMLVGLIISLCCVNQSNAQVFGGEPLCSTDQLYTDLESYSICTSDEPIIFSVYDGSAVGEDCNAYLQTATFTGI